MAEDIQKIIVKSAGFMLALMFETQLPLTRFSRGERVVYTTPAFGPLPDNIYDWAKSSPVRFTERHVVRAIAAGIVRRDGDKVFPTSTGYDLALACSATWGPLIDEYFNRRGYNTDWREWT